jgi:hypothetical protein
MLLQKIFIPLYFRPPIHLEDPLAIKVVVPELAFLVIDSMCAIAVDAPGRVATGITCNCGFDGRIYLGVALTTPSECMMVPIKEGSRKKEGKGFWHLPT